MDRATQPYDGPLHEDPAIHARRWLLLGVMCLALVMIVMSVSGLNVALPAIQRDLDTTSTALQWIVDAYSLVFAGLLLTAGALGDRFGRRRALLSGLGIFAVGALVAGVATGSAQVIAGRVVMGLGAAFIMPATLSLITTVFPPQERRKAIAVWAGFAGAGGAIGPIVSGGLLEGFWWGSALLVNIPVVAVVIAAVATFAPESKDPGATPLDPAGAGLSLVGLGGLVFGIIEGPVKGWTDAGVVAGFVAAVVCLGGFVVWERRARHPMLPLGLFGDRRFSVGSGVVTSVFFAMFGFFFLYTQYLQFVRGDSPLTAGLATLPLAITLVAVAPRSAVLGERLGTGPVMAAGFVFVAAGFAVLATVEPSTAYLVQAGALVLLGIGMSLTAAPATGSIMSSVPPAKAGVGSAVNDTTRELGGALGIAVLGSIVNAAYRSGLDLGGLDLPPPLADTARESVGAATRGSAGVPGATELASRAGDAFSQAFNLATGVSAVVALAAAAVVMATFGKRKEQAAEARAAEGSGGGHRPEVDVPA